MSWRCHVLPNKQTDSRAYLCLDLCAYTDVPDYAEAAWLAVLYLTADVNCAWDYVWHAGAVIACHCQPYNLVVIYLNHGMWHTAD